MHIELNELLDFRHAGFEVAMDSKKAKLMFAGSMEDEIPLSSLNCAQDDQGFYHYTKAFVKRFQEGCYERLLSEEGFDRWFEKRTDDLMRVQDRILDSIDARVDNNIKQKDHALNCRLTNSYSAVGNNNQVKDEVTDDWLAEVQKIYDDAFGDSEDEEEEGNAP